MPKEVYLGTLEKCQCNLLICKLATNYHYHLSLSFHYHLFRITLFRVIVPSLYQPKKLVSEFLNPETKLMRSHGQMSIMSR